MVFHVGQKVVCVDDGLRVKWRKRGWFEKYRKYTYIGHNLNRGDVYTIMGIQAFKADNGTFAVLFLAEAAHSMPWRYMGFPAHQFRPVKTTSIEVFRQMLVNPPGEEVDA